MTSTRPYLLRAFYDWIVDNGCTPHVVVNATLPDVEVPVEYIEGGQIVLNVAVSAVQGLLLGDQSIEFKARFSGKVRYIHIPIRAVMAIYAKENGRGMVFSEEEGDESPPPGPGGKPAAKEMLQTLKGKAKADRPSFLKIVK